MWSQRRAARARARRSTMRLPEAAGRRAAPPPAPSRETPGCGWMASLQRSAGGTLPVPAAAPCRLASRAAAPPRHSCSAEEGWPDCPDAKAAEGRPPAGRAACPGIARLSPSSGWPAPAGCPASPAWCAQRSDHILLAPRPNGCSDCRSPCRGRQPSTGRGCSISTLPSSSSMASISVRRSDAREKSAAAAVLRCNRWLGS
mmetsp:Transcript_43849/g.112034  ORF Transcript_43849/g.112034 Transcript_43849/m.112034 type:complete len:201 (-) Transcript_43849:318-920(-)